MSPAAAFASDTVLTYIVLAGALLSGSGPVLLFLTYGLERQLGSVWRKYCGWLFMVPLILAVVLAGRAATIVSVAVLAMCGFREFARATVSIATGGSQVPSTWASSRSASPLWFRIRGSTSLAGTGSSWPCPCSS